MALPGSGTISLNDIYNEFPGTLDDPLSAPPVGLDEYYRGGTYVPYISANYGIPTSGTIAFNNFYNGVGYFNFEQTWSGGGVLNYNLINQLVSGGWDSVKPVYAAKITHTHKILFLLDFLYTNDFIEKEAAIAAMGKRKIECLGSVGKGW